METSQFCVWGQPFSSNFQNSVSAAVLLESLQNVFCFFFLNLDVCINIFRFLSFIFLKKNDIAVWFCSSFILTSFTFFCVHLFTPKPILPCCDLGIGKGAVVQYFGTHLIAYTLIK